MEAAATLRWREVSLLSMGVQGTLAWRGLFIQLGFEPSSTWDLEGRPVSVQAIPLGAGWRPTIVETGGWRLAARLGFQAQWINIQRLELDGARRHSYWEGGGALGLSLSRALTKNLRAGLGVEGCWYPWSRVVEVPEGPSDRLNLLSLLITGFAAWELAP